VEVTGVGLGTDGGDGRRRRLGPCCGRGGDGRRAASRAVRRPRRERRLGPRRGGGNLPARGVLAVFLKSATYPGFADPQNRELDLHRHGGITEKTSFRRKNLGRRMSPLYLFRFCPYGLFSLKFSSRGSLVSLVRGLVGLKEERGHQLTMRQPKTSTTPSPPPGAALLFMSPSLLPPSPL